MDPSNRTTNLNGLPPLWELDKDHKPVDQNKFSQALETFQKMDWTKNEEGAKRFISHLNETNLAGFKNFDAIRKTERALFAKFPDLFISMEIKDPKANITITNITITKDRLKKLSPKFERMLDSGFRESQENKIVVELSLSNLEETEKKEVIDQFLNYLETGELDMTGETVLPLLYLAQEHDLPHLLSKAEAYIVKNLEIETLGDLLDVAIVNDLTNLKWACLQFVHANSAEDALQTLLTSSQISDSVKNVIQFGIESSKLNISFNFSEGVRQLIIPENNKIIDDKYYVLLNLINEDIPIRSLHLGNIPVDQMERLSNSLPDLHQLYIRNDTITSIPDKWLSNLKELDCSYCRALKTLTARKAEKLDCIGCPALTTVKAPEAKELNCSMCRALTTVTVPKAKELNCSWCPALTTVKAPEAKELNCSRCDALQNPGVPDDCVIVRYM